MTSKNDQSKSDAGHNDTSQANAPGIAEAAIDESESVATDTDAQPSANNSVDKADGIKDEINDLKPKNTTTANDETEEEGAPDLQQLQARVAELEDELLRNQAEMENIRKRAVRDVERARKFALEPFVTALLPTIESLTKARGSLSESEQASAESRHQADQTDGIALCLKLLLDTLTKFGVEEINPLGEPFDPNLQEAMTMIAQPEAEPNTVVQVLEIGYTLNKRLIRAAKVIVSSSAQA